MGNDEQIEGEEEEEGEASGAVGTTKNFVQNAFIGFVQDERRSFK